MWNGPRFNDDPIDMSKDPLYESLFGDVDEIWSSVISTWSPSASPSNDIVPVVSSDGSDNDDIKPSARPTFVNEFGFHHDEFVSGNSNDVKPSGSATFGNEFAFHNDEFVSSTKIFRNAEIDKLMKLDIL